MAKVGSNPSKRSQKYAVAATLNYCTYNCFHWFVTAISDFNIHQGLKEYACLCGLRCTQTKPQNWTTTSRLRVVSSRRPTSVQGNRDRQGPQSSHGKLPMFDVYDIVLVTREDFCAEEKLSLHWKGLLQVLKTINDYVYHIDDLCNKAYSTHIRRDWSSKKTLPWTPRLSCLMSVRRRPAWSVIVSFSWSTTPKVSRFMPVGVN